MQCKISYVPHNFVVEKGNTFKNICIDIISYIVINWRNENIEATVKIFVFDN